MPFRRRLMVTAVLASLAMMAYLTANYYSASLTAYVVEQALLQKVPQNADPELVQGRFRKMLDTLPDRQARLHRLLAMSQYLEKLQQLTPQELDELLRKDASTF
jgi:hypothetical protein